MVGFWSCVWGWYGWTAQCVVVLDVVWMVGVGLGVDRGTGLDVECRRKMLEGKQERKIVRLRANSGVRKRE